jgi:hypothetical protein
MSDWFGRSRIGATVERIEPVPRLESRSRAMGPGNGEPGRTIRECIGNIIVLDSPLSPPASQSFAARMSATDFGSSLLPYAPVPTAE